MGGQIGKNRQKLRENERILKNCQKAVQKQKNFGIYDFIIFLWFYRLNFWVKSKKLAHWVYFWEEQVDIEMDPPIFQARKQKYGE